MCRPVDLDTEDPVAELSGRLDRAFRYHHMPLESPMPTPEDLLAMRAAETETEAAEARPETTSVSNLAGALAEYRGLVENVIHQPEVISTGQIETLEVLLDYLASDRRNELAGPQNSADPLVGVLRKAVATLVLDMGLVAEADVPEELRCQDQAATAGA